MRPALLALLAFLAAPSLASAEILTGTVTYLQPILQRNLSAVR